MVAAQDRNGWLWLPLVVSVLVITALEIVASGQTAVVQFLGVGEQIRPIRR